MLIEERFDTCSRDASKIETRYACASIENEGDAQRASIV